jgi:hypothetical protein
MMMQLFGNENRHLDEIAHVIDLGFFSDRIVDILTGRKTDEKFVDVFSRVVSTFNRVKKFGEWIASGCHGFAIIDKWDEYKEITGFIVRMLREKGVKATKKDVIDRIDGIIAEAERIVSERSVSGDSPLMLELFKRIQQYTLDSASLSIYRRDCF